MIRVENTVKNEPWINMRQACEYTSLSIDRVRRGYNNKEFRVSKVTGRILTKKSWLDEWLDK